VRDAKSDASTLDDAWAAVDALAADGGCLAGGAAGGVAAAVGRRKGRWRARLTSAIRRQGGDCERAKAAMALRENQRRCDAQYARSYYAYPT
jgi:hypothetical protein